MSTRTRTALRFLLIAMTLVALYLAFGTRLVDRVTDRTGELNWLENRLPALHKNLFFQQPEAEYRAALADLRSRKDQLDQEQYFVAVWQVLAGLGDGHTGLRLSPEAQADYKTYPLGLYWFSDGLYVVTSASHIAEAIGCRVVAIDGMPIADVMERVATVVAKENDVSILARSPGLLVRPDVLYGLGVTERKDRAEFLFERAGGGELRLGIEAGRFSLSTHQPAPIWLENNSVIWHRYLAEYRTLYIQYNSCQGDLAQATAAIASVLNSDPVERIVFDMRRNGGGNSAVAQKLIDTIAQRPEVREPGHLFVIVGRGTYSSAILNSYDFRRRSNAIFIGEPTAGKPNCYGEVKTTQLRNFTVHYSVKYFQMVADEDPPSFVPDIVVEQTAEAFFAGRDTVLEAILAYGTGQ